MALPRLRHSGSRLSRSNRIAAQKRRFTAEQRVIIVDFAAAQKKTSRVMGSELWLCTGLDLDDLGQLQLDLGLAGS